MEAEGQFRGDRSPDGEGEARAMLVGQLAVSRVGDEGQGGGGSEGHM